MCTSSPNIPPPPPPPQDAKAPTGAGLRRGRGNQVDINGGTMLTGPSGIASNSLVTGAPTLLGGVRRG